MASPLSPLGFGRLQTFPPLFRFRLKAAAATAATAAAGQRRGLFQAIEPKSETEATMKVLNVAEKNDAAKNIARIMNGNAEPTKRRGFSKYNMIYEFSYSILGHQNVRMVMTSVSGHLLNLDFTSSYRGWTSCSPLALFDAPVVAYCPDAYKDIKRNLEKEIRGCDALIIWTDGDREGENIGFEIISVCRAIKPKVPVHRARFSEITATAIRRACNNLVRPDERMNDAVELRKELDLRIGAAFTRFQTLRLKHQFPRTLADNLVSYGSCQFPTLGFVVERYKSIENFIPEEFWKIKVFHSKKGDSRCEFVWDRGRLFDQLCAQVIHEECLSRPEALVTDVINKPKSKWRPLPMDTVELEKLASKKLRIPAKETMRIAEKLYTSGFISYPRTETNKFAKGIDLRSLVDQQTNHPDWGAFARRINEDPDWGAAPNPRQGSKSDEAHPPIHPLKPAPGLTGNEARVYELIARHFLACCSQDARGSETVVHIRVAEEKFVAQGLIITERNYLDVYPYDRWSGKEIPDYSVDERFDPDSIDLVDGETTAPPLLTEADLISLMEKHGIGTDATHADHINTIKEREYVGVQANGTFLPGKIGMGLVTGYDEMGVGMSKPDDRAALERDLVHVCNGVKTKAQVLEAQVANYRRIFEVSLREAAKLDESMSKYLDERVAGGGAGGGGGGGGGDDDGRGGGGGGGLGAGLSVPGLTDLKTFDPIAKCPSCGRHDLTLKTKKDNKGFFIGCEGYPDCRAVLWLPDSALAASVNAAAAPCRRCGWKKLRLRLKPGSLPAFLETDTEAVCVGGCDEELNRYLGIKALGRGGGGSGSSSAAPSGNPAPKPFSASQSSASRSSANQRRPFSSSSDSAAGAPPRQLPVADDDFSDDDAMEFVDRVFDGRRKGSAGNSATSARRSVTDSQVVCGCGQAPVELMTKKEGANQGRLFLKCSTGNCNFFSWSDSLPASQRRTASSSSSSRQPFSQRRSFDNGPSPAPRSSFDDGAAVPAASAPYCRCGLSGKLLTVRKEGPNTGREFFGCSKGAGDQGCGFFEWADSEGGRGRGGGGGGGGESSIDPSQNSTVCNCGVAAVKRTVSKDGPNKGREFWVCVKPRDSGSCGFFQWADGDGGGGGGGGGGVSGGRSGGGFSMRGSSGAGRSGSATGSGRKRKCGNCGTEGHTKLKCPALGGGAGGGGGDGGGSRRGRGGGRVGAGGRGRGGKIGTIQPPEFW